MVFFTCSLYAVYAFFMCSFESDTGVLYVFVKGPLRVKIRPPRPKPESLPAVWPKEPSQGDPSGGPLLQANA